MKNFEYAQPRYEQEAVTLLADPQRKAVVLAGGTDLVGLMKKSVVSPDRVVNIREIESLQHIERDADGNLWVGAAVSLEDFLDSKLSDEYPSTKQVIQGISSIQLRAQGTLVGELLRRPECWYFRHGHGLLADRGQRVVEGDNRYHAILGNRGPAKFVNASRLAPALISLGASVRVLGPEPDREAWVGLMDLYQSPRDEADSETTLQPGQLVTHVVIPPHGKRLSAAYEVRHGEGPDSPLASAAVSLEVSAGRVRSAILAMGHVAPTPWLATRAAESLQGKVIDEATAEIAGAEAVAGAIALSQNEYKIQLAQVAVKRALLRAVGNLVDGFQEPSESEHETQLA
jgi:xanthine dehydrogenase YagS FAD-binding subunit